jgi:hypothetical protein
LISQSAFDSLLITNPNPSIIARVKDLNPRGNPTTISGTSDTIGLVQSDRIHVLNPSSDFSAFNWKGSILSPNTLSSKKYRIISNDIYADYYGDVDGDGEISDGDYVIISNWLNKWGAYTTPNNRLSLSDGYVQQLIADGELDPLELLRADVNGDGYVDSTDQSLITNYVEHVISNFSVGSTFSRCTLKVEDLLDPLTTTVNMWSDTSLINVPYSTISWSISYFATWISDLLEVEDTRRLIPTTFIQPSTTEVPGGKNDFYVPGDFFIDGQIKLTNGNHHAVDLEVNSFCLNFPTTDLNGDPVIFDGYSGILLFDSFVAESSNGKTALGFDALKYADGTYVQIGDFEDGKVKITATIQSTSMNNKMSLLWVQAFFDFLTGIFGGSVDINSFINLLNTELISNVVDLTYNYETSLLTLNNNNTESAIDWDSVEGGGIGIVLTDEQKADLNSRSSINNLKVLITVYLKKAGFRNIDKDISESEIKLLLDDIDF